MKKLLLAGVAVGALVGIAGAAQAAVERTFSGTGASGSLGPAAGQEPWIYSAGPGTDVGWGSPGFSQAVTASAEAVTVSDFEITYAHPLDAAQITVGNGAGCAGGFGGGTTFCSFDQATGTTFLWTASFSAASPDSITFTAPDAAADLTPGEDYFVNIALLPGDGVSGGAFTGSWSTAAVPAPLIGHGFLALLAVGGVLFGSKLLESSRKRRSLGTAIPRAAA